MKCSLFQPKNKREPRNSDGLQNRCSTQAAKALPPKDEQLMSQGDKLELIMPPDRTAITQENPRAFSIVHSFE